jgi:hypothetical protein
MRRYSVAAYFLERGCVNGAGVGDVGDRQKALSVNYRSEGSRDFSSFFFSKKN